MKVGRGVNDIVFVDVDGTLLIWPTNPGGATPRELEAARRLADGTVRPEDKPHLPRVNKELVRRLYKWSHEEALIGTVVIWTMGGKEHAEMARTICGMRYADCMAKPDLVIDDNPEGFKRKLPVVKPEDFRR